MVPGAPNELPQDQHHHARRLSLHEPSCASADTAGHTTVTTIGHKGPTLLDSSELIDGTAVASPSASDMEDNVTSAIQVYGTSWCRLTYRVREYLMQARLSYEFFDVDHDQKAHEFVLASAEGQRRFPLVVVEDDVMTVPTIPQLQRVLDAHEIRSENPFT
jgi:glutaredoxin